MSTTPTKCESPRLPSNPATLCLVLVGAVLAFLSAGCATVSPEGSSTHAQSLPLSVVTSTLPSAQTQSKYSASLAAAGGTAPYTWALKAGSLPQGLSLQAAGQISGTPTQAGNASFTLQVNDSSSPQQTAAQSMNLSVVSQSTLAISTTSLPNGTAGTAYSASLSATGGTAPYSWSISSGSLPGGLSLSAATGTISGTPTTAGTTSLTVLATDSSTPTPQTATQTLSIAISASATILQISTSALPAGQVGQVYSTTLSATGGTTPYAWSVSAGALPSGLTLNATTGQIGGTPTTAGTSSFTLKATDSTAPTAQTVTKNLSITVSSAVTSVAITTTSLPNGQQGSAYSATLAASGGTTPYVWSISSGSLPAGLTLNAATGAISGNPTQSGTFPFTAEVTDSSASPKSAFANFSIVISASVATLQITTTTLPAAETSSAYSATLAATGGTQPYNWTVISGSLPAGISLSSAGLISGTPTQAGTSTFTIQVADAETPVHTASQSFSIAVALNGGTLVVTNVSVPNGQAAVAYSASLTAIGGMKPYTWSISSGALPPGLTLNSAGAVISGTPTQAGTFSFTLQVKDSAGVPQTASKALSITIAAAVTPVQISTSSLASGQAGVAYGVTLVASGGTTPYTWSISSGALPTGLSLNASTGQISGMPSASGTFSFTAKVTDSTTPTAQTATKALSLTIAQAVTPVSITTTSLANGQQGTAYSATLAASGGTTPYSWSISSGALPAGVTLSSAGSISGTPTVSGTFSFTAKVTDSTTPTAQTAVQSLSITLSAAVTPVNITTTSLANGQQNSAYSATLAASGGTTPYSWSISSGALPTGLTLNASSGAISGTPTGSGTTSFTVKATDSTTPTAQTATKALSITVSVAVTPVSITTTSLSNGQQNSAYSATLAASGGTTPYTWSISSGALPAGLTLNASSGAISGTPTGSGTTNFTIKVTDSTSPTAQTGTKALSITVSAAVTPVSITTTSLGSGQQGTAYSASLSATGGTTPYSWSISSGALPAGLTLNASSGAISGTPTTSGSFSFTVKVTDSTTPTAQTATKALSLTIAPSANPLFIETTSLPDGQQSNSYSATLVASGGNTPYSWSISSGSLPAGLTLNAATGAISGTPTTPGSSPFNATVTDSTTPTALTSTSSFTITIIGGTGHSVVLTWGASPSSGVVGYNVYRSNVSGSSYSKINATAVSGLTYTDGTVVSGETYYYVLTATDAQSDESGFSSEVPAVIP